MKCLQKLISDQKEIVSSLLTPSSIETVRILVWLLQTRFTSGNNEYKLLSIPRK